MSADPHAFRGAHPTEGGVVIRAIRPAAKTVTVFVEDKEVGELEPTDTDGLFEGVVRGAKLRSTTSSRSTMARAGVSDRGPLPLHADGRRTSAPTRSTASPRCPPPSPAATSSPTSRRPPAPRSRAQRACSGAEGPRAGLARAHGPAAAACSSRRGSTASARPSTTTSCAAGCTTSRSPPRARRLARAVLEGVALNVRWMQARSSASPAGASSRSPSSAAARARRCGARSWPTCSTARSARRRPGRRQRARRRPAGRARARRAAVDDIHGRAAVAEVYEPDPGDRADLRRALRRLPRHLQVHAPPPAYRRRDTAHMTDPLADIVAALRPYRERFDTFARLPERGRRATTCWPS